MSLPECMAFGLGYQKMVQAPWVCLSVFRGPVKVSCYCNDDEGW